MAKRFLHRMGWFGLASVALIMPIAVLTGCAGGAAPANTSQSPSEKPTFDVKVAEVRQLSDLGDKRADGQYVLVRLLLNNQTDGDRSIAYETITLALQPDGQQKAAYQQPQELGANILFMKEYGAKAGDRIFKVPADTFHPRVETERYSVFVLPNDADLSQYHLRWQPPQSGGGGGFAGAATGNPSQSPSTGFDIKLVGAQTVVKDLRNIAR